MRTCLNNQASVLVLAALVAAVAAAGCENELADDGAAALVANASGGGGECVPCSGDVGLEAICCPLKTGGEPYDPCFGACGSGTVCDGATQKCVACDDGNTCTDDSVKDKKCVHTNNTVQCDDNDKCTTVDKCSTGKCVGGGTLDCTDNNSCTTDTCVPATGCVHTANDAVCDDDNSCTTGEKCLDSKCVAGIPLSGGGCDDGDAGTVNDVCVAGTCSGSEPLCDDSDVCTVDVVNLGDPSGCTHTAVTCDDGNTCTNDSCDPATGCGHVNNTATCDDGDACTTDDKCSGGKCAPGPALTCDDGKVCTDDACDPATGCKVNNNVAACSDGNACTLIDKCGGGVCLPGATTNCEDNNPCTSDSCDNVTGCVNAPVPNCSLLGEVCGDGLDNDGDGKLDCADTECVGSSDAYTLHAFAAGGGTISLVSAGIPGGIEFQLPAQSAGADGVPGTGDDLGPMYFTFACSEVPFSAKVSGSGQTVAWVTASAGGPPPAVWLPGFWWPWNVAPVLNPGVLPSVVGQSSFSMGGGGSLLVRWPPQ